MSSVAPQYESLDCWVATDENSAQASAEVGSHRCDKERPAIREATHHQSESSSYVLARFVAPQLLSENEGFNDRTNLCWLRYYNCNTAQTRKGLVLQEIPFASASHNKQQNALYRKHFNQFALKRKNWFGFINFSSFCQRFVHHYKRQSSKKSLHTVPWVPSRAFVFWSGP